MFRLIVVTLAALFAVLQVVGDPERRPAASRGAVEGLSLAGFTEPLVVQAAAAKEPASRITEAEAIRLALEAGKAARKAPAETHVATANLALHEKTNAAATAALEVTEPQYWMVSGTRVNIRKGPGTENAVVAQVTRGMEAEVLDAQDGWFQIVTRDGSAAGWISEQFLKDQRL